MLLLWWETWQFNLVAYFVSVVLFFQFCKLSVARAKHDGAATIVLQVIAGVSVLVFAPFFQWRLPSTWQSYALLLFACVFYALFDRLQTTARRQLEVSQYAIISQLANVFLMIVGFVVFREAVVWVRVAGAALILAGNVVALYQRGARQHLSAIMIGVLSTIVFAIAVSIDIGVAEQFNMPVYIMITLLLPAAMLILGERLSLQKILVEYRPSVKKYYLVAGISWACTIFFSLRALTLGSVTTVVPLQAAAVLLNIMVSYVFMGERDGLIKKIIASIFVLVGVLMMVGFTLS